MAEAAMDVLNLEGVPLQELPKTQEGDGQQQQSKEIPITPRVQVVRVVKQEETKELSPTMMRTSSVETCSITDTPPVPFGDVDTGYRTPGTDISNISYNAGIRPEKATSRDGLSRQKTPARSAATIAEFRQNQMKCMEALRKGARAQALVNAIKQTPEQLKPKGDGQMIKQVSEEASSVYSMSESIAGVTTSDREDLVADPLVSVVRGISSLQREAQEELLAGLGQLKQEAAVQRQEMQDILRKHSSALAELKRSRNSGFSVLRIFAAAFGGALGLAVALRGDLIGSCVRKCRGQEGNSFVLMQQKPNFALKLVASAPHTPRAQRSLRQ